MSPSNSGPAHARWQRAEYRVDCDPAALDLALIHRFLSEHSYWARGIPRALVERALANSLCFGLFDEHRQLGFARVISDCATFAWLADVFVVDQARGRGLGKWLVECVLAHPQLQALRRFMLVTRDAHGLYAGHGFSVPEVPANLMAIVKTDLYSASEDGMR
ncbi:GNAT family N-acetyltransferase [Halotalea alkalilenta]|uniref:GNAT family N-acetyltransferase n=1 Tax=Halotalea alkalilenta TaxID=376489 RepID=UPI000AA44D23|nr:GNAT family N-acetyltransferase [Halotalea alkalilenta]